MSEQDKQYKKLPVILQTTAIKNFFESTVDQLFSKANVENIQGFLGSPRSRDFGAQGAYLEEITATKRFYGLLPTINTLNPETGSSENLIYYDELVDTLKTYGVDVRDHNKIFSESYASYLPPIDIDKFINYPEYYWYPEGPTTIEVSGTLESPIDVDTEVLGSANFQPPGGKKFRNGMIVKFVGDFVIPQTRVGIEYVVQGVGESIFFVPKVDNFSTRFSTPAQDQYDAGLEDTASSVQEVHSSSLLLDTVDVINPGQGYVDPEILIYDTVRVSVNNSNGDPVEDLRKYWDDTASGYVGEDLREIDPDSGFALTNVINLAHVVESLSVDRGLAEYQELVALYANFRTGNLANLELTLDSNTGISNATITNTNHLYSDQVRYLVYDEVIEHTANIDALLAQVGEFDLQGNVAQFETNTVICDQTAGVSTPVAGQQVTTVDSNKDALFTGVVQSATSDGSTITITLQDPVTIPVDVANSSVYEYNLKFTGFGFLANLVLSDFVNIVTVGTQSIVAPDGTVRTEPVLEVEPKLNSNGEPVQQKPGRNPNNFTDYYVINALPGFDQDSTFPWSGTDTQEIPDYLLQQRGAANRNVWSRVNFWYHKENFRDAGDSLPPPSLQARRPIIEFDRNLELFNHGERSLGFVTVASDLPFEDIDGRTSGLMLDGVPSENSTFIFPGGSADTAGFIYTAQTVVEPTAVKIVESGKTTGTSAVIDSTDIVLAGEGALGYIESIGVSASGSGYTANAVVVQIDSPYGVGAQAQAVLDANGNVVAITLFDRTPTSITINNNTATVTFDQPHGLQNGDTVNVIDADPPQYNGTYEILAINDTQFTYEPDVRPVTEALTLPLIKTGGRQHYQTGTIRVSRLSDPAFSNTGVIDGDPEFVALKASVDDTVQILGGATQIGAEFYYNGTSWIRAQTKLNINQAPLFNLYDSQGWYLADPGVYPESDFAGNQIFGYATQVPANDSTVRAGTVADGVLGFPLVFKQFKSTSEILFENYQDTEKYHYTPMGSAQTQQVGGYYYYLLAKQTPEYHSVWRTVTDPVEQRIRTFYNISQTDVDNGRRSFFVGSQPNVMLSNASGYDINLRINNKIVTDFSYGTSTAGYIDLGASITLQAGDFVEADIASVNGLFSTQSISKYDTPLGWGRNSLNQDVPYVSEPEYLEHFADYLQQPGLQGAPLGLNNSSSLKLDPSYAQQIVSTSQDIMLGAYLLDDQPHNLIDAIRFVGLEFTKYKNRVRSELDRYNQNNNIDSQTPDVVLEQILRNVISFRVANQVFDNTYVIPFGDNFEQEQITVALDQTTFVFQSVLDLDLMENSLLIYHNDQLLRIDNCYSITDFAPVTVQVHGCVDLRPGDIITARFYNRERDSAQCPPTPSVLGLYPLYVPQIVTDNTFQQPVQMILGHDGSRTPLVGDSRDQIILEFEKRIYNAAKQEFRERNSLPEYNVFDVRDGAFRNAGYSHQEFYDLMRSNFARWTQSNDVDPVTNEFFDANNPWTWNYGNAELPGHWRGVYEYYYDTDRPHLAPWEMLGFTEKPLWWDSEYTRTEFNVLGEPVEILSYGSDNTALWQDLELGIIRQGARQNVTADRYLTNTPYERPGLTEIIPVDAQGKLIPPYELFSTATTRKELVWANAESGAVDSDIVSAPDISFDPRTQIWVRQDGTNVGLDTSNVYVSTPEYSYTIPRKDLHLITQSSSPMPDDSVVGVLITGEPLYGIRDSASWQSGGEWNYNLVRQASDVNRVITPESLGISDWQDWVHEDGHSKIVGWAFDGLPIYGPYGYQDPQDANTDVVAVQSAWALRSGNRATGPGGTHTGAFVQDYQFAGTGPGKASAFNTRYGVTPDSPSEDIRYYVVTVNENLEPAFPYQVGGGVAGTGPWEGRYFHQAPAIAGIERIIVVDQGGLYDANTTVTITGDGTGATATAVVEDGRIVAVTVTNVGENYTTATATVSGTGVRARLSVVISTANNSTAQGYQNPEATPVFSSIAQTELSADITSIAQPWKFGDGAPVENAWRYSENYPFAIAEALLLAKPGRFARVFAKPDKLFRPTVDPGVLLNRDTGRRWQFADATQFPIHGEIDASGDFVAEIGYTQFIHSWLQFQGLQTTTDFAAPMRTLNMKLAHRMSGYVDKDTMTVRTDQFSNDGNATSLIIPQENITVTVHSSAYKSRNFYSGVQIEKTAGGYRVRGYDTAQPYFVILQSDTLGPRERVTVGGEPASSVLWESGKTYRKGTIVERQGAYWQANLNITSGGEFDRGLWTRLAVLPQIGGATSTLYQRNTGRELRVNYETEFATVDQVYDFLISLGRYQQRAGYDFGEYDENIADVRNWAYAGRQFLFWTTGRWEIGNTLELSPLAPRARFSTPLGFIAEINRAEREQFSVVNAAGAVIDPKQCEIIRENNQIEVAPPEGEQIYGILLYVKEVEHALVLDNFTEFADVIYNPVLYQKHSRVKVSGTRTAGWTGRLLTEGFIVEGNELKPNLDNLAQTMGRFYELGFVPVEKQVYEQSRAQFGYEQRDYLRELDIIDDQQFDFYRGMIQSKGTTSSLTKLARSRAVVDGNISVFGEWALRVGDFGDTENKQRVELRINKSDLVQDPQLITLDFPEDITNIIDRVDILEAVYTYPQVPEIRLPAPTSSKGTQATAVAQLGAEGRLARIDVVNPGSGYDPANIENRVIAVVSDVVVDDKKTTLSPAIVQSANVISFPVSFELLENISNTDVTVSNANTIVEAVDAINNANVSNLHLTARAISVPVNGNVEFGILLVGSDYTVLDGDDLNIPSDANVRYQPKQKYGIITNGSDGDAVTTQSDITVFIDNVVVPSTGNWTYSASDSSTIQSDVVYPVHNDLGNTSISYDLGKKFNSIELDSQGRYEFIELYINGVRVRNTQDSVDLITGNVTSSGQLFEIDNSGTNSLLVFPDITLLPDAVLSELKSPPADQALDYGEQRVTYFGFDENTEFQVLQKATVEFQDALQLDRPGSTVRIQVTANDRIVARTRTVRTFEISADIQDPNVISIDIDDADRFLVRPTGVRENNLWPTINQVNHTGITASRYADVPNAGYVNPANVTFQAYDLASLPDLYADNIIVQPDTGDLVHMAVSENSDWNVYRLRKLLANESFLFRNDQGTVDLYTDVSLFNFLDSNQIGQDNTGKFLDYVLTLKNSNVSDNVVVWRNEDIVQAQQFDVTDFTAPRMIEARIASIGPASTSNIVDLAPTQGRTLQNLTLTPFGDGTNRVLVTGPDMGDMRNSDAIQLIDNVGTINQVDSHVEQSGSTLTLFTGTAVFIQVVDGGDGYTEVPDVTVDSPPAGTNVDAIARVVGTITDISVSDSGDFSGAFVEVFGAGSNAELSVDIINGSVTEIDIVSGGSDYDTGVLPAVTIEAPVSGVTATAEITADDVDETTGAILRIRITEPGSGYTASNTPNVTITASQGNGAEATAVVRGNIDVSVTDGGDSFFVGNTTVRVAGDGAFARGEVTVTGSVDNVLIVDGGTGFTDTPNVTIDAPVSGNTALANATLSTGIELIEQAQSQSSTGDAFVKILITANTDVATSTALGVEDIYAQAFNIVGSLQKEVFLAESLDTSNNSFEISDQRFDQTLELIYTYELAANANANTSMLTLNNVNNLQVSDTVLLEGNSIGNVSNILSEVNQAVLDTALVEDLEAGTELTVLRETANVSDFLDISGYSVITRESYAPLDSADNYHLAQDVTVNSFVISRANTAPATNVLGLHLNQTRLQVPDHCHELGDMVRVITNVFSGDYIVDALSANTITINQPFAAGFQSGEIVQQGIRITTTDPHGITPVYAANDKRIAVHFAEPLYYNKVYPISAVTPDSIFVDGVWAVNNETQTFYEKRTGTVSGFVPFFQQSDLTRTINSQALSATNTISVSRNARLNDFVAHYTSNSAVISPKYVTIHHVYVEPESGNVVDSTQANSVYSESVAVIDPAALSANTQVNTDIVITRQSLKPNDRYAVMTTLDHDTIDVNGVRIRVDNYNSPQAVAASINRAIGLRRSMIQNVNGRMGMQFAMLKDPRTAIQDGRSANQISNYGPYVRDENVINSLGSGQFSVLEELPILDPVESVQDPVFDQGAIRVGPHRGLTYYDPALGRQYVWNSTVSEYRETGTPALRAPALQTAEPTIQIAKPEFHQASKKLGYVANWTASTNQISIPSGSSQPVSQVVYVQDTVVYYQQRYYRATQDIDVTQNATFDQSLWQLITSEAELAQLATMQSLILRRIPGSARTCNAAADVPGVQRTEYDLSATVTLQVDSQPVELARYRLRENSHNAFQIYEAVQHELDDEPYYILIDQSSPLTRPHDFYGTINAHNDFGGYQRTDYYYENGLLPVQIDNNLKLVAARDPVIIKRLSASVVSLPPVEPALREPEQTVPEPFAVQSGNGTSATENFLALPRLTIASVDSGEAITDAANVAPGGTARIIVEEPGYNQFLLWVPGLTPGEWKPTQQGPGGLPGNTGNAPLGLGRGYYAAGDGHQPDGGGYPVLPHTDWNKPLPRFLYSSKFSVSPAVRNYTDVVYTDSNGVTLSEDQVIDLLRNNDIVNYSEVIADLSASGDPDINNTRVRPEEIFVACFWTEPHRYHRQLVGWDYKTLDARGIPQPIHADYDGTVVRVKYIRLTELPADAVTQRLIPDTGWAGKNWANNRTDTVNFQNTQTESDIWSQFETDPVRSGSTGSLAEKAPTRVVNTTNSTGGINNV